MGHVTDCFENNGANSGVCVGTFFIRRLKDYSLTELENENLRLKPENFSVEFRATGGLTIKKLVKDEQFMSFRNSPDIVFIQMGENDLDNGVAVEKLSRDIISYSNFLIEGCDIKTVVIGQLLWRRRSGLFNDKVVELNKYLQDWCSNSQTKIIFHHHHGFWSPSLEFLANDGVHIRCTATDKKHMHKYLQSVKRAILRASKLLDR